MAGDQAEVYPVTGECPPAVVRRVDAQDLDSAEHRLNQLLVGFIVVVFEPCGSITLDAGFSRVQGTLHVFRDEVAISDVEDAHRLPDIRPLGHGD